MLALEEAPAIVGTAAQTGVCVPRGAAAVRARRCIGRAGACQVRHAARKLQLQLHIVQQPLVACSAARRS